MVSVCMISYTHFSVLGQIQLRERFDSTRKKLALFPWSRSAEWLYQPRGGAWEEGP